jgi:formylglycine-generating enzyme required for sulfatase activity
MMLLQRTVIFFSILLIYSLYSGAAEVTNTVNQSSIIVNIPGMSNEVKPIEMILIKAGTFRMGSPSTEKGRRDDELQHQVMITKDFYIGKYEVTQAQWQIVMGNNPSSFRDKPNKPVEKVSWEDCQEFISKLNKMCKKTFRLPTEAEWEYACRAETTTQYFWGEDDKEVIKQYCWFKHNARSTFWKIPHPEEEGYQTVGLKQPNAWGLFDMCGNTSEWCQDWYGDYPATSVIDPTGANTGKYKVLRGGCWNFNALECRSAIRFRSDVKYRYYDRGLRLSMTPQ